jgi:hypothetical protein
VIEAVCLETPRDDESFLAIALRYLDGLAAPGDDAALAEQLLADADRRAQFVMVCRHAGMLRETFSTQRDERIDERRTMTEDLPVQHSPFIIHPSATIHYPLSTIHYALFSYTMATLIVGVGMLIGWWWKVSEPLPIARQSNCLPSPAGRGAGGDGQVVGRITGMVDCRWAEKGTVPFCPPGGLSPFPPKGSGFRGQGSETNNQQSTISNHQSPVSLGDHFAISSGLLEITYNTGAKVILQGPVKYEVESNGGFLSVGKLTGKLENKVGSGQLSVVSKSTINNRQSAISPPSSVILHPSSFAIHTPTATVTDLGTEFGVEVTEDGTTESQVFRGAVAVNLNSPSELNPKATRTATLRESESIRVERSGATDGSFASAVTRVAFLPNRFVRALPPPKKPLPRKVLAHFRMGEDDPGAKTGRPVADGTYNHGDGWLLNKHGLSSYSGDTAAPGSSLAIDFSGAGGQYLFRRYVCKVPVDNFILEAWVRPMQVPDISTPLVYIGDASENGYGLMIWLGRWRYLMGGVHWADPGVTCEPGRWTHVATVCERGRAQLWINGRPTGAAGKADDIRPSSGLFTIGGHPYASPAASGSFKGQIDEVRLSELRGPFDPTMLLFPATNDGAPTVSGSEGKEELLKGGDVRP